jgi:hypothetical protein
LFQCHGKTQIVPWRGELVVSPRHPSTHRTRLKKAAFKQIFGYHENLIQCRVSRSISIVFVFTRKKMWEAGQLWMFCINPDYDFAIYLTPLNNRSAGNLMDSTATPENACQQFIAAPQPSDTEARADRVSPIWEWTK